MIRGNTNDDSGHPLKEIIFKQIRQQNYKWLTVDLEENMFENFECNTINIKSMFSTFDWLRDIRFQCASDVDDLLDLNNDPSYTEEEVINAVGYSKKAN